MTKFKAGDRVRLVERGGAWCPSNVSKNGTVVSFDGNFVEVYFDNSEDEIYEKDWGRPENLQLISEAPIPTYETITINGKLYNLVPVEA